MTTVTEYCCNQGQASDLDDCIRLDSGLFINLLPTNDASSLPLVARR